LQTYAKTVTFFKKFIKEHGSVNCRELLDGLDMNNPADLERIQSEELFNTRCPHYVATATQIVEQMFDED
jgi:hypothetical protein